MNSVKIQQLLKADPIRPPVRKRSPSPNSQISPIQTPSRKDTPLPASTHASFFTIKSHLGEPKDEYDPGEDEKISVSLPYTNFNGSEKESPNFRYRDFVTTNNKNSISRYSRNDNHSPELIEKDVTNLSKKHEKRISFGPKKSGELLRNNNLGKENNGRQLNYNDDSYSNYSHPKNLPALSKKGDAAFTFESEEVKHSKSSHEINPNHTSREELQQTMTEKYTPKGLDRSAFEQQTVRIRRKSQNIPEDTYYMPMHRKVLSEKSFEKFFGRKASDPLGHLSHLLIPEKSAISDRYCQTTNRNFYSETLREMENAFKDKEDDFQLASDISKADKKDQIAFNILQSRCGQDYAEGLYYIYARYSKDNDLGKTKMTYQKLISFMKNFNLFSTIITKEFLGIAYAKRCPNKIIDFAAFIDILFKISKRQISSKESEGNSTIGFKIYLNRYVLNNYLHLLEQQQQTKTPRLSIFSNMDDSEQLCLDVLLENEGLLNHIFTLYETFDIQYHNKSILLFKDFKKFCYDYTLVPVICTLGEAIEVFRKFQIGSKQVIDYRGFTMALISFATIGFGEKKTHNKYDNLAKQLSKFFDVLAQINSRVCDQLVSKHIVLKKK